MSSGGPKLTSGHRRASLPVITSRLNAELLELVVPDAHPSPHDAVSLPDLRSAITYTAVSGHRAFVIAIVDLYSRKNMAYSVVNTMDTLHCVETLQLAVSRYGVPEIFNSDQGSQFTSREFTDELKKLGIAISMDGRGRCRDNAKRERFWWALKYEDIKLKDYVSLPQLRRGVQSYVNFYNGRRLRSALGYLTPDSVYEGRCVPDRAS